MKYLTFFYVRIPEDAIPFLPTAIKSSNLETNYKIELENLDENFIAQIGIITENANLKEIELHFIIFDFAYLLQKTTLIYI